MSGKDKFAASIVYYWMYDQGVGDYAVSPMNRPARIVSGMTGAEGS